MSFQVDLVRQPLEDSIAPQVARNSNISNCTKFNKSPLRFHSPRVGQFSSQVGREHKIFFVVSVTSPGSRCNRDNFNRTECTTLFVIYSLELPGLTLLSFQCEFYTYDQSFGYRLIVILGEINGSDCFLFAEDESSQTFLFSSPLVAENTARYSLVNRWKI